MARRRPFRSLADGRVSHALAALNARHPWSHNDHFHGWILSRLPQRRSAALDVGCGEGGLVAAVAPRIERVDGCDSDERMRTVARQRCAGLDNVTILDGGFEQASGGYDLITMVAVLHHLDPEPALRRVRSLLAPGGRFLAVNLAPPVSAADHVWDLASILTNPLIGYVKHPWPERGGPTPAPYPVQEPTWAYDRWREHVQAVMPGAVLRRRLAFRHTIEWTSP